MPELEQDSKPEKAASSAASQVLRWARCHPGVLIAGSLGVAVLLARKLQEEPPRRPETEADFVDGETPLFI